MKRASPTLGVRGETTSGKTSAYLRNKISPAGDRDGDASQRPGEAQMSRTQCGSSTDHPTDADECQAPQVLSPRGTYLEGMTKEMLRDL